MTLFLFMTYSFLLEFSYGELISTGYVICFFMAPSNATFDHNSFRYPQYLIEEKLVKSGKRVPVDNLKFHSLHR
jgi:hypothetical protein